MVTRSCEVCRASFSARQADIDRGWGRFCSKSCKAREQERRTGQNAAYLGYKKSTAVAPRSSIVVAPGGWQWRTHDQGMVYPANMETRHLFYTLRMIWNNSVPERMRVGAVKLYRFGPFYTPQYVREAIYKLAGELSCRTDIHPAWADELRQMKNWMTTSLKQENLKLNGQ